mmetsp:Transcript_25050/g.58148  ORF Transcript_25050/g.58148 Transcript_25050/m.58148 type:complete len:256 (-) Transcript_25050:1451-2218(-)
MQCGLIRTASGIISGVTSISWCQSSRMLRVEKVVAFRGPHAWRCARSCQLLSEKCWTTSAASSLSTLPRYETCARPCGKDLQMHWHLAGLAAAKAGMALAPSSSSCSPSSPYTKLHISTLARELVCILEMTLIMQWLHWIQQFRRKSSQRGRVLGKASHAAAHASLAPAQGGRVGHLCHEHHPKTARLAGGARSLAAPLVVLLQIPMTKPLTPAQEQQAKKFASQCQRKFPIQSKALMRICPAMQVRSLEPAVKG